MNDRRPTGVKVGDYEILEGDNVWGTQPRYYNHNVDGGNRHTAGTVFWSDYWSDWRILEGSFAEFYAGEKAGYPLIKMINLKLMPSPEITQL